MQIVTILYWVWVCTSFIQSANFVFFLVILFNWIDVTSIVLMTCCGYLMLLVCLCVCVCILSNYKFVDKFNFSFVHKKCAWVRNLERSNGRTAECVMEFILQLIAIYLWNTFERLRLHHHYRESLICLIFEFP